MDCPDLSFHHSWSLVDKPHLAFKNRPLSVRSERNRPSWEQSTCKAVFLFGVCNAKVTHNIKKLVKQEYIDKNIRNTYKMEGAIAKVVCFHLEKRHPNNVCLSFFWPCLFSLLKKMTLSYCLSYHVFVSYNEM